jgi:hypothetical protein
VLMVTETLASQNCGLGDRRAAWVGQDKSGQFYAWIDTRVESSTAAVRRYLPLSQGERPEAVLPLLAAWPAWELARLATVELGSRILVAAEAVPTQVLIACRGSGCGWLGLWGPAVSRDLAVHVGGFSADLRSSLFPGALDGAILLQGSSRRLDVVLPMLRTGASLVLSDPSAQAEDLNTYPDLHGRGLILRALAVDRLPTAERWAAVAPRLRALREGGLLKTATTAED